jgi:hypothetical protein
VDERKAGAAHELARKPGLADAAPTTDHQRGASIEAASALDPVQVLLEYREFARAAYERQVPSMDVGQRAWKWKSQGW